MNTTLMWTETLVMLIVGTVSFLTIFYAVRALRRDEKKALVSILTERKQAILLAERQARPSGTSHRLKTRRRCYPRLD